VALVPERLTVLCVGQKPTDVEIKGSGLLTFLSDCTSHGNTVIIRSLTVHSVNNTVKVINHPLNLTHDCCEMTVDALPLGEIQLGTPMKKIRPMMGICIWQTTKLRMFINLSMNRNGRLHVPQKECHCYL